MKDQAFILLEKPGEREKKKHNSVVLELWTPLVIDTEADFFSFFKNLKNALNQA